MPITSKGLFSFLFSLCIFTATHSYAANIYSSDTDDGNPNISSNVIAAEIERALLLNDSERDQLDFYKKTEKPDYVINNIKTTDEKLTEDNLPQISISKSQPDTFELLKKQKLAYNSLLIGQYEVSIELYKQLLKKNPNDLYTKFALASTYQKLKQFKQAKSLYYELLKSDSADREKIISNLLAMMSEESPDEAISLLSSLVKQNPDSAYIMAQMAFAYSSIDENKKALFYAKRALEIDSGKNEYRFNVAILYDKIEDYRKAIETYTEVLDNYNKEEDVTIPQIQIENRIKSIKSKLYNQND